MVRLVSSLVFAVLLIPVSTQALTLRDVIELHRAGLGEDVLLALIEVDPTIFAIDAATLKSLKAAGISERVIIAMIKSGRTPAPQPPVEVMAEPEPLPPMPQVVVIEHDRHETPQVREVAVPVPVPVYVPVGRGRAHEVVRDVADPYGPLRRPPSTQEPSRRAEPVYWGFGGKLRPDAWQPAAKPKRDAPDSGKTESRNTRQRDSRRGSGGQ